MFGDWEKYCGVIQIPYTYWDVYNKKFDKPLTIDMMIEYFEDRGADVIRSIGCSNLPNDFGYGVKYFFDAVNIKNMELEEVEDLWDAVTKYTTRGEKGDLIKYTNEGVEGSVDLLKLPPIALSCLYRITYWRYYFPIILENITKIAPLKDVTVHPIWAQHVRWSNFNLDCFKNNTNVGDITYEKIERIAEILGVSYRRLFLI